MITTPAIKSAAAALGRLGGQAKSNRKAAASRRNGKRGGWPKGRPRKAPPVAQEASEAGNRQETA